MKFRKKPVIIEAVQFFDTDECIERLFEFIDSQDVRISYQNPKNPILKIKTKDIEVSYCYASVGDWIIKGIDGKFYPCKPDVFEETYEPVEGN